MPLVASSEAAFEALVIDLQGLLFMADYGHKLYVHLVPEPWQVACLQRHGGRSKVCSWRIRTEQRRATVGTELQQGRSNRA